LILAPLQGGWGVNQKKRRYRVNQRKILFNK
jgi:hypothetical protein